MAAEPNSFVTITNVTWHRAFASRGRSLKAIGGAPPILVLTFDDYEDRSIPLHSVLEADELALRGKSGTAKTLRVMKWWYDYVTTGVCRLPATFAPGPIDYQPKAREAARKRVKKG